MRPRQLRRTLALMAFGAILAGTGAGYGIARADGVLDDAEAAYVITYGPTAVCPTIDEYPSKPGVYGVMQGIMDDGWTADASVDIINASVLAYCEQHWPLLQRLGAEARARNSQARPVLR